MRIFSDRFYLPQEKASEMKSSHAKWKIVESSSNQLRMSLSEGKSKEVG